MSKELNEARVWLLIISRSEIIKADRLQSLIQECTELCRIISASIKTISERQTH
jgi:four helix bundle protein